ncbi:hypothetical protein [Streptomyces sp. DH37]|uniref:hypothetical protein n=1 Tax=Streptomyces sp. DH37 TaxID=3040122 RepID=UPI002441EB0A|nr:hypothetical protein [Streptomyces sp. DH37]MDG9703877.1 hypothetical protein [Streptomyces sp. DH37]
MLSADEPFAEYNPLAALVLTLSGVVGTPTLLLCGLWTGIVLLVRIKKAPAAATWTAALKSAALLVWAGAVGMYTWGLLHLMFTDDYGESMACHAVGGKHVVGYDPSFVPLRFGCRLDDGRTVDVIVPGYVNAWAFSLAGCALVLTLIVRARNKRSGERTG